MVRTASEWAASGSERAGVEIVALDRFEDRPAGPRYGTLVHAALAIVPLDADLAGVSAVVRTQARIVAATDAEIESAVGVVSTVLAHPLLAAARTAHEAGRCLRETPVTATIDGVLIEGVVDFAFEIDGSMTAIDFKTDDATGELLEQYRRQVGFYADAIARATGKATRAVLMRV